MRCDPNAYCLLIPENSEFKCECKPGYNGTGKVCTDVCLGFCDNEGVCLKDSRGQPSCRCSGSFTGKHCSEKSEFFYVMGGIASGVVLVIFIVLLVWMICVRFVRKNYNFSRTKSVAKILHKTLCSWMSLHLPILSGASTVTNCEQMSNL